MTKKDKVAMKRRYALHTGFIRTAADTEDYHQEYISYLSLCSDKQVVTEAVLVFWRVSGCLSVG